MFWVYTNPNLFNLLLAFIHKILLWLISPQNQKEPYIIEHIIDTVLKCCAFFLFYIHFWLLKQSSTSPTWVLQQTTLAASM